MKILLSILIAIALIIVAYFVFFIGNCPNTKAGLVNDALRPCSSKPNCVNSQQAGDKFIEPIAFTADSEEQAWGLMKNVVERTGGTVKQADPNFLWAEYRSTVFRFVDDVEILLDFPNQVFHIRSGARSGMSDFGVNAKRIEEFRRLLAQ